MNKKAIRITKIIGFTIPAAILALVITIEYFYYRGLSALPGDARPESNRYSQFLLDSTWVTLGGEGDIKMYRVSPVSFVTRLVYAGLSSSPGHRVRVMHASEGLVRVVSTSLILKNKDKLEKTRKDLRQINYISAAIWVSNNWNARDGLNYVLDNNYFGRGCWGIPAAAENYFGKTPGTLTNQEALLLLGLFRAPAYYKLAKAPEKVLQWSNIIRGRLAKNWPDKYGDLKEIKKIPTTLVKPVRRCKPDKPIG